MMQGHPQESALGVLYGRRAPYGSALAFGLGPGVTLGPSPGMAVMGKTRLPLGGEEGVHTGTGQRKAAAWPPGAPVPSSCPPFSVPGCYAVPIAFPIKIPVPRPLLPK